MKMIERMVAKANAQGCGPVEFNVSEGEGFWIAMICDGEGEAITTQRNWNVYCLAQGATMSEAVDQLDAICAEDFA